MFLKETRNLFISNSNGVLKKLLYKLAILAILVILIGLVLIKISEKISNPNSYEKSTIDKEKRLAEITEPKIIIVGGSNIVFGIDSKRIADSLHRPVVNMGLFASTGLDFILNESIGGVRENDIVIICTEYYMSLEANRKIYIGLIEGNTNARKYAFRSYEDQIINKVFEVQRSINSIAYRILSNKTDPIHRRDGFNEEGDLTTHLNQKNEKFSHSYGVIERDYSKEISRINTFVALAKQRKAVVYYLYPCLSKTAYSTNVKSIANFERKMNTGLNCSVIGTPKNFVYDDSLFFNTVYHLNKEGRQLRTTQIIEYLK